MVPLVPGNSVTTNRRMRVVLVARSLDVGGAEVQLVSLARGLDREVFDVHVACLYARGALLDDLRAADIPIVPLGKRGRWDLLGFMPRLVSKLRNLRPDVVHAFLGPPNILTAIARPWLSSCRLVWGVRASNMDLTHYDWSWRLSTLLERILAGRADRIVANSSAGRDFAIANGLPSERLSVIPNGIDTTQFVPDVALRASIRMEWGVFDDAFLIGKIARLDPMKDHLTFLRSVALAVEASPDIRFVCVGEGPAAYAESLRREADFLGLGDHVIWAGTRHDMTAVYSALDATTLTSAFGEGFPNAVGEAMACERACVVTDVGDAARIVGDTGIVVSPGDVAELVRGWQLLSKESSKARRSRGMRCRVRIVDNFSLRAMVDAYGVLYREIANSGTRAAA